jgi:hydroxyethylthiazole kinase
VLDPVGCGATTYRTAACVSMLKLQPTVVRGNGSEILALAGAAGVGVLGLFAGCVRDCCLRLASIC